MWAIRILNGDNAGKVLPLKKGKNIVGRGSGADVRITDGGVSKQHAEVSVYDNKVVLTDLNSRNGTFVNGVRVQNSIVKVGDKIGFYQTMADIFQMPKGALQSLEQQRSGGGYPMQGNTAMQPYGYGQAHPYQHPGAAPATMTGAHAQMQGEAEASEEVKPPKSLSGYIKHYIDQVALPGVYHLPEVTEFRNVIGGMILVLVLAVTALSVLPMIQITRTSIQKESQRRALSLARALANINQQALAQGFESGLTTEKIKIEDGVTDALVIRSVDGGIVAPAKLAGDHPDLPFVHKARIENREVVEMVDMDTVGASVPISFYSSETGTMSIKYHAVVLYDMGALAIDEGRTASLFIQTLVLALFVAVLIYFFMVKLIEYPFLRLNKALESVMREESEQIQVDMQYPAFQKFVANLNTLLARMMYGENKDVSSQANKSMEAENMIQLVGYPALALNSEGYIISVNSQFESLLGRSAMELQNQTIQSVPDQALQLSIGDLVDRTNQQPEHIATNELDFGGETFLVSSLASLNKEAEIEYTVITISPLIQEEYE